MVALGIREGPARGKILKMLLGSMVALERELLIAEAIIGMALEGMMMGTEVGRPLRAVMEMVERMLLIMVAVGESARGSAEVGRMTALVEARSKLLRLVRYAKSCILLIVLMSAEILKSRMVKGL